MANLVDLPLSVAGEVIGEWLDFKGLVNVDSAFCNQKFRSRLLEVIQSSFCILDCEVQKWSVNSVKWLLKRQVKLSDIKFSLETDLTTTVTYLRQFSRTVHSVWCDHSNDNTLAMVASYTRNLTCFALWSTHVQGNWNDVLWFNPQLEELYLDGVTGLQASHFDGIQLKPLRILQLQGSCHNDELLIAIVRGSAELTHIDLESCKGITDAGLTTLAQHCPLLICVGLAELCMSDQALTSMVKQCPLIRHLDISCNKVVTDAGIFAIAQSLIYLCGISISDCPRLSQFALTHLTDHCAHTLEIVHLGHSVPVREGVLITFLQKCTKLHTLSTSLQLDKCCKSIVPHMCNLKTLLLWSVVTDDMLIAIAKHCKILEVLDLEIDTTELVSHQDLIERSYSFFNRTMSKDITIFPATTKSFTEGVHYTQKGLFAIARGLPKLRLLGVLKDFTTTTGGKLALELWRVMCPRLHITSELDYSQFDILEQN